MIEHDLKEKQFKIDESKIIRLEPKMICSVCFQQDCNCFYFYIKRIFKNLFKIN